MKDGKELRLRKGTVKYSSDKMAVAVFESLTEKVCDGSCYGFTNMRVQKYSDERVLKAILTKEILV